MRTSGTTLGRLGGHRRSTTRRGGRRVTTTRGATSLLGNGIIIVGTGTNSGNGLFNSIASGRVTTRVGGTLNVRVSGGGVSITSVGGFNRCATRVGLCRKVITGVAMGIARWCN